MFTSPLSLLSHHAVLGIAIAVFCVCTFAANASTLSFQNTPTYAVGTSPVSAAVGDFNHDGIPDLAVANASQGTYSHGTVSILLGRGDGSFLPAVNYNIANDVVFWVVTGDFNGDGNLDLVVAHDASLDILLGKGDGTFGAPTPCYGHYANEVFVGDFNGDHKLDLVVLTNDSVLLLLGKGDGTFQPPSTIASSSGGVHFAAVADFNNDGLEDLAISLGGSASPELDLLLGNGDGTFRQGAVYATGAVVRAMAVADFNGDGIPDMAAVDGAYISSFSTSTVEIFLGNGDGSFRALSKFRYGWEEPAGFILAADFNRDGKMDLVLVNDSSYDVSVMLGKGDGTFAPSVDWAAGGYGYSAAAADLNGDGNLDLVVTNFDRNSVGVLLGVGDGTFQAAPAVSEGVDASFIATGDFNGDGKPDLAIVNTSSGSLGILLGKGASTFGPAVNYNAQSFPSALAIGDFNGDHIQDVAVLNTCANSINCYYDTISIFLGNGDGTFRTLKAVNAGGTAGAFGIVAGDFNGDGYADILVSQQFSNGNTGVSLLLSKGDGTFQKPVSVSQSFFGGGPIAVGDLNRDGKLDFVSTGNSSVVVFLGNGDGTIVPTAFPVKAGPSRLAVADVNNDGNLDVIGLNFGAGSVTIMLGNGDGTLQPPKQFSTGSNQRSSAVFVTVADFNQDGNPDIAVVNQGTAFSAPAEVAVLLGNGDGTFQLPSLFSIGDPYALTSADFNGDGKPDIALANGNGNNVILLINAGK